MKVIEDKKNFLLKRREILANIEAEKTPSFEEAKEILSKELKTNKEVIVIKKIEGNFGSKCFEVKAFIYDSKEDLEKTEKKPKAKKSAETLPSETQKNTSPEKK